LGVLNSTFRAKNRVLNGISGHKRALNGIYPGQSGSTGRHILANQEVLNGIYISMPQGNTRRHVLAAPSGSW
jgi:hypothetical protein